MISVEIMTHHLKKKIRKKTKKIPHTSYCPLNFFIVVQNNIFNQKGNITKCYNQYWLMTLFHHQ